LKNIVKSPAMQTNGFMATLGKDSASMCFKECVIKSEEDLAPEVKEKNLFFLVCMFRCKHCEKNTVKKISLRAVDCTCWLFERNNY